jgi:hypothetical protein
VLASRCVASCRGNLLGASILPPEVGPNPQLYELRRALACFSETREGCHEAVPRRGCLEKHHVSGLSVGADLCEGS